MEFVKTKMSDKHSDITAEISIVKGTSWSIIGTFVSLATSFAVGILLARYLGAKDLGIWTLSLLVVNLGLMIGSLGLTQGVMRFVGLYRGQKRFNDVAKVIKTAIIISLVSGMLLGVIIYFLSPAIGVFFKKPLVTEVVKIVSWSVPFGILGGVFVAIFQGFEDIRVITIIGAFFRSGLWLLTVVLLVLCLKMNLWFLAVLNVVVGALVVLGALYLFKRHYAGKIFWRYRKEKTSIKETYKLISFSLPLLLSAFLDLIKTRTDIFMLGFLSTASAVGMYNVAFRISSVSPFILGSVVAIFLPVISSKVGAGEFKEVKELYFRATKWSFAPTLIIIITFGVFSNFFLNIFGKEFLGADIALKILLLTYLVHTLTGPNGATLVALGETKFIAFYTLLGASSNIILNWIMIPKYGISGAAFASLISVAIMNVLASWRLYVHYNINPFFKAYIFFLLFSFIAGLGFSEVLLIVVPPVINIGSFFVIFSIFQVWLMYVLGLIDEKDKLILKRIWYKIKLLYTGS